MMYNFGQVITNGEHGAHGLQRDHAEACSQAIKEIYAILNSPGRDNFMAMFSHPFMAHHGLYLMMHRACIINEHESNTMKEAFINDISNMVKLPEQTEQNNNNNNGAMSNNDVNGHVDDDKGNC